MGNVQVGTKCQSLTIWMGWFSKGENQGFGGNECRLWMNHIITLAAAHHHAERLERLAVENFAERIGSHSNIVPHYSVNPQAP
jgi:hypothetical protein